MTENVQITAMHGLQLWTSNFALKLVYDCESDIDRTSFAISNLLESVEFTVFCVAEMFCIAKMQCKSCSVVSTFRM